MPLSFLVNFYKNSVFLQEQRISTRTAYVAKMAMYTRQLVQVAHFALKLIQSNVSDLYLMCVFSNMHANTKLFRNF